MNDIYAENHQLDPPDPDQIDMMNEHELRDELRLLLPKLHHVQTELNDSIADHEKVAEEKIRLEYRLHNAQKLLDELETWEHPDDPSKSIIDSAGYNLIEKVGEILGDSAVERRGLEKNNDTQIEAGKKVITPKWPLPEPDAEKPHD